MKYLVSFRTTLRISRYLSRAVALLLWLLGALVTVFYLINVLHGRETAIRQELTVNYEQVASFVRDSASITRQLKFIAENRLSNTANVSDKVTTGSADKNVSLPEFYPLYSSSDCNVMSSTWHNSLASLSYFLQYWKSNVTTSYELNRVFFTSSDSQCLADYTLGNSAFEREKSFKSLQEHILRYRNGSEVDRKNSMTWVSPAAQPGIGSFYMMMPVYLANKVAALLGVEQTLRLEDFIAPGSLAVVATLVDQNNQPVLSSSRNSPVNQNNLPADHSWFGYLNNYDQLVFKRALVPSNLSIVYSIPGAVLFEQLKMVLINALLLNLVSALMLFTLAWLFERRMFLPAEDNAHRLEEHEQFNRKIVASAPVGICILRISDGTNILSNELAHNYLNMLTHEDRQRLTEMICGQQVNFVDVLTGSNTNLQISFVHSRYRNENVAICVLVDVSTRVQMERSLHEMAQAAEQASQSKSMFLATVSHELRTPLYGIIGNLDLLQTKSLPKGVDTLVTAMNNSSNLLLKIISDILDFSKIESEQLRIEPREFSPVEILTHITANYLSLIVKKHLTLYVLIEHDVPATLDGDPMRLQQVISNLLNNAIKFTHTGGITLHAFVHEGYLAIRVRDTGVGIPGRELTRLFDPFFQVGTGVQRNFQGTGLGLAICEKLVNMMDGDIQVDAEPGMGSQFIVRIPLYNSRRAAPVLHQSLAGQRVWLVMRNDVLAAYLTRLLAAEGMAVYRSDSPCTNKEDVLISDYLLPDEPLSRATILFDNRHIEAPVERAPGHWVISTVAPHELPLLLAKIYGADVDAADARVRSMPVVQPDSNEDILILVVDDHPINRMLLSEQLNTLGYQVKMAQDGMDALNVMGRSEIDIVLTDVNMPNMDGYRLTQRLRESGWTFPIVGVTANALAEEKRRCIDAGMDSCLSKPVTLDTLRHALARYAEQVRRSRQQPDKQSI
ncbi:two-component system sensor histidine kinase/response regulator [Erwinia sp. OLTSP20]|uniref:two-component system sensor histidine kinase RcsC n=1 Tax=unclassified Erwinia TaxID=2622719 RepID=UPI000C19A6A9|nr:MULTISPECIES: two-component system sensor histidine kinase RcsC [unclassified Erwinia]PIJ50078.1 two-component system sensor histidine kinase/response regulator [Erwinia sp. OAMSP11]PIJ71948.1 two-component system sensor histidine kinase/response regulator [Erwinia sp. OLSSP12]PIJ80930.1 two-component system sensor histidine kinase/response regulator [Erwinia sp. OLCASP19]PIJ83835.1 two-component system sensor histidine kinase/response regulator [Erwinia sp. OLMTSP26]PIJ85993.1 two-componen